MESDNINVILECAEARANYAYVFQDKADADAFWYGWWKETHDATTDEEISEVLGRHWHDHVTLKRIDGVLK